MKEMVGGCCVCSDERGWTENPLVYCDGLGCTVAVHQACYGIVTVPSGPWFCRKCESQENAARVRCELCPSRDGALKKSDNDAWAHVVCALYIPEVRFGNVTTMEPIILQLIPAERFNKTCYICEEGGKGSRAQIGACMQCNKSGCKQQFHVTCAQSLGLLCEEAGNYLDNVKYCGYCQHHYSKLKKGGNVKTIPPYKPVHPDNVSSDSSPEKEVSDSVKPGPVKRKNSAKCTPVISAPNKNSKPVESSEVKDVANLPTSVTKFTNSNFVESVVTNSESVFGAETPPVPPPAPPPATKKRKSGSRTPTLPSESEVIPPVTDFVPLKVVKVESEAAIEVAEVKMEVEPPTSTKSNVITSTGIVVSVPLTAATSLQQTSAPPTLFQQLQQSMVAAPVQPSQPVQPEAAKRRRSQSSEKPEKGRKNKRTVAPPPVVAPVSALPKRSSRSNLSTPTPPPPGLPTRSSHPSAVPKDSPPSSPESEAAAYSAGPRKNKKKVTPLRTEQKDVKLFSNGVSAPHMLGNQLNPSSNMSKKLSDTLSAELEAHSVFTDSNTASSLVGPQLHSRVIASVRSGAAAAAAANSAANPLSMGLGAAFAANQTTVNNLATVNNSLATSAATGAIPQSLDQLLERQWEQGSQFLMEQAQHFDIASLLSCLHQLRAENLRLEEHVNTLLQRRDHLLAVNARLAIPLLTTQPSSQVNNVHAEPRRVNNSVYPHTMENGLDNVLYPSPHRSPPQPPSQPPQPSARTADNRRLPNQPSGYPQSYQVSSSPTVPSQLSAATSQAIHSVRRDAVTDLHQMTSKHS